MKKKESEGNKARKQLRTYINDNNDDNNNNDNDNNNDDNDDVIVRS